MALRISKKFKFKGIKWESGKIFKFKYRAWNVDPLPLVILLYKFSGTHPTTKRQWRFIQCINLNYVPRNIRRNFILSWKRKLQSSNNVYLTWEYIKQRYPQVANSEAIRRYFYSPNYYTSKIEEIPIEYWEDVVIGSLAKDLSRRVKFSLIKKYRNMNNKKKQTKSISKILKSMKNL